MRCLKYHEKEGPAIDLESDIPWEVSDDIITYKAMERLRNQPLKRSDNILPR